MPIMKAPDNADFGQSSSGGTKHDTDKARMDLLSPLALEELGKVLGFGAKKYGEWNWSKGIVYSRLIAAILRHTFAFMRGEDKDPETGISHIAHAMTNCMFILHFEKTRSKLDDREKKAYEIALTTPVYSYKLITVGEKINKENE